MATEPDRPAGERDRMAVVQALSAARRREELAAAIQLERTEQALDARTIGELEQLLVGISDPPELPVGVSRRGLFTVLGGVAALAVAGGAIALNQGNDTTPRATPRNTPAPTPTPTLLPTPTPTPVEPPKPDLMTVAGLKVLLEDYRKEFGTWWSYELSVSGPRAARSDVPIGALRKRRLQWWSWDPDEHWNTIFDPMPASAGDQAIDLRKVNLKAALANLPKAKRSLGVENPGEPDMEFTHDARYGAVVQFYVSNSFKEGGVMFTDLAGKVIARHPFERS